MDGQGKGFIQKKYEKQILKGSLYEIFEERHFQGFFYIEDGSRIYGLKDIQRNKGLCNAIRIKCHINTIFNWPGNSPDFNPIENMWRILKQGLRNRNPHGGWIIIQLKAALINIWEHEITIEDFNKYINFISERLAKVRARRGAQTPY